MEFKFDPRDRRLHIRTLVPAGRDARIFTPDDQFQFGIEEEYFLSDAETGEVPAQTPDALFQAADFSSSGHVGREFLQAQIEVATEPHCGANQARQELLQLRRNAAAAAAAHGLAILACGTHPRALWRESVQSPKDRYDKVMDDLQMIGQRNMLCGMHVHVEFPDPARRIDVMMRMLPYLPLFIALSTSSPFWQRRATGLKGYRLAAYDELPRTGLPELFRTNRGIRRLCRCHGAIGRNAGRQPSLVGDPAVAQIPDLGAARAGLLHAARRHDRDRGAISVVGPVPLCASRAQCRA